MHQTAVVAHRGTLEVFHRSWAAGPLEIVHLREEHVAVVVADNALQNVELPTSAVATNAAAVASVLGGSHDLS